ncbi:hypothetical protein [Hymenobacter negativus]|uniref:GNAT family N-acetyltransferase n=1 Tax=Hymenobacter negativus TaxID=2795026 RepID=A0ABS3QE61_9BACT|nr:hypothetical protein [Hymenobacter negativus]MBO2009536.1 hypothetical protein [Hymenobacter negativus]
MRQFSAEEQEKFGVGEAANWNSKAGGEIYAAPNSDIHWLLRHLAWDSNYFGTPTFRLFTSLFGPEATSIELIKSATALRQHLIKSYQDYYAFSVVPAEDVKLLQALTGSGWRLVETRLTYYRNNLSTFEYPRFPVREARMDEAVLIGQVSASARNLYDRFHADTWFGNARADAYLAHYAENTVARNLASTVLVPNVPGLPVDSFLAISDLITDGIALGGQLSRVLLTAVGTANRGWHVKLVAETLHRAKELGHEAVLMTTQATNHAVFRTCDKLGFRLGAASHVLSSHSC